MLSIVLQQMSDQDTNAVRRRAIPPAIRTILLRDFVEATIANVVEPNDVPVVIKNCWSSDDDS